ncbi:hypothetical protein LTR37_009818 [Vermiconidia calcicola]|uniref:Uncharacterized protein n=1 Tax=Vermiconidia calcicola TaxID=1690605 RepID=A0ACC3N6T7_9PEZI|nr:hypothetical protein LTR37_009818 [Vermiconidia calcicola]
MARTKKKAWADPEDSPQAKKQKTSKTASPARSAEARSPEEEGGDPYGTPPPVIGPYYGRAA